MFVAHCAHSLNKGIWDYKPLKFEQQVAIFFFLLALFYSAFMGKLIYSAMKRKLATVISK